MTEHEEQGRDEGSAQDARDEAHPGSPGPEHQADGQTQQDAGLDGGAAKAAQGEDERVGTDESDPDAAG